jgi:hypothetical protein
MEYPHSLTQDLENIESSANGQFDTKGDNGLEAYSVGGNTPFQRTDIERLRGEDDLFQEASALSRFEAFKRFLMADKDGRDLVAMIQSRPTLLKIEEEQLEHDRYVRSSKKMHDHSHFLLEPFISPEAELNSTRSLASDNALHLATFAGLNMKGSIVSEERSLNRAQHLDETPSDSDISSIAESDFASLNTCNRVWNALICLLVALMLPGGLTLLAM